MFIEILANVIILCNYFQKKRAPKPAAEDQVAPKRRRRSLKEAEAQRDAALAKEQEAKAEAAAALEKEKEAKAEAAAAKVVAEDAQAALKQMVDENSGQRKRQRARQAILGVKIKLSKNMDAAFNKYSIANHYAQYHPDVQRLVQNDGWWPVDVIPVLKNTLSEHPNAQEHHVSFVLKLRKNGNTKTVHACSRGITDQ